MSFTVYGVLRHEPVPFCVQFRAHAQKNLFFLLEESKIFHFHFFVPARQVKIQHFTAGSDTYFETEWTTILY